MFREIARFIDRWLEKRGKRKRIRKEKNVVLAMHDIGYSKNEIIKAIRSSNFLLSEDCVDFIIRYCRP